MVLNKKKVLQNFFYKNFYRGTYMLSKPTPPNPTIKPRLKMPMQDGVLQEKLQHASDFTASAWLLS